MTVERVRLDNGLCLLFLESHEAPVVAVQAWVDVGSADEDDGTAGIAHLHEHMLFKGTVARGVGEIARSIESSGGEINAWTSYDQTVYHVVLEANDLGLGIDVLADALRNSSFVAAELSREIEVVVEEIKRAEDVPARRVSNALFALAYERHPYRRPVLGSETTVRSLSRERVLNFFSRHYRPSRTTVIVAGDFDRDRLLPLVQKAFGSWVEGEPYRQEPRLVEPPATAVRLRVLREDVKEARVAIAWHIPGLRHADTPALDAMALVLGHGDSSRLYVETRRRQQLVNDIYAYAYTPRDPGLLMMGAGVHGENLLPAVTSMLDEAYRLREHLVSDDELSKAKAVILSDTAYQRETVQGEARRLGYHEVVAGDHAYEERYRAALRRLSVNKVRHVARRYLTAFPSVVVQVPESDANAYDSLPTLVHQRFVRAERRRHRRGLVGLQTVQRVELDSGAILLVRHTNAPVVAIRAVALGGMRWETRATAGKGSLFASVFGLSTEDFGALALARRVALLGGSLGAFSGRNTVGLRGEFVADNAQAGLQLFCDALLHPVFQETDLERERAVLLERVRTREDNPAGVAFELFAETLFPHHPYGLRIGGTATTLKAFTREQMLLLRRQYLSSDKLVVAVVGDIDGTRAIDLLSRELEEGHREPSQPPPAVDAPPTSAREARLSLDKKQVHVIVGGMGTTLYSDDRFALEILTTVLSGQSGRLFLDLRDKQGLAYAVSSSSVEGLDPGYVLVHMGTSPEKLDQALVGLDQHLNALRQEVVSAKEIERAQRYLIGAHAIDLQRVGARAMLKALGERFGQGHDDYRHYPTRIRAVTAARVQEAAERYLAPQRLVRVVVGPGQT